LKALLNAHVVAQTLAAEALRVTRAGGLLLRRTHMLGQRAPVRTKQYRQTKSNR
jgi:hypothetical protein